MESRKLRILFETEDGGIFASRAISIPKGSKVYKIVEDADEEELKKPLKNLIE